VAQSPMNDFEGAGVFLSASFPDPQRDPRFFETADIVAIAEATRALATITLTRVPLVFGGHPSITPLIAQVGMSLGQDALRNAIVFQSAFFEGEFPVENKILPNLVITEKRASRKSSLAVMREKMLSHIPMQAGVFIGGMEGVHDEFKLFRKRHDGAKALPVATTGGAALEIFREASKAFEPALASEYAYAALFRRTIFEGDRERWI